MISLANFEIKSLDMKENTISLANFKIRSIYMKEKTISY